MSFTVEDLIELLDEHKSLYKKAKKRGSIGRYASENYDIEYAIVSKDEISEKQPYRDTAFGALFGEIPSDSNHWERARLEAIAEGDYAFFVIKDSVPEEFYGFLAVHEYEEMMHKGHHGIATMKEFEEVARHGEKVLREYSEWWINEQRAVLIDLDEANKDILRQVLPEVTKKMLAENYLL